jgi:hypothetical protein
MMNEIRSGLSHRANPDIHRPSRNARQHTAPDTPSGMVSASAVISVVFGIMTALAGPGDRVPSDMRVFTCMWCRGPKAPIGGIEPLGYSILEESNLVNVDTPGSDLGSEPPEQPRDTGGLLALISGVIAALGSVYVMTKSIIVTMIAGIVALLVAALIILKW